MILAAFGIYGVCVLFDGEFVLEYILGIAIPLSIGIIVVSIGNWIHKNQPKSLTQFFLISFFIKMLMYGMIFIILFNFYSFSNIHFILSFVFCFVVLHISEAIFFKITFR
jgi:hypothetical protein